MTKIGHKYREDNLKKHADKIIDDTNILISLIFEELKKQKEDIDEKKYIDEISTFFHKIQEKFCIKADLKIAYKQLAKHIIDGNKSGKWSLKVPVTEVRYKEPTSYRNDTWFVESTQLNKLNNQWLKYLSHNNADTTKYNKSKLLGSVLLSASFNGGLCLQEELLSLANFLIKNKIEIFYQNGYTWIDLVYKSPDRANNIVIDDIEQCYRRWYPDSITLSWIHNYLSREFDSKTSPYKEIDIAKCWKIVHSHLMYIDSTSETNITTLKKFCLASIGVTENIPGVDLSFTLSDYCVGKISSSSLRKNFQLFNDIKIKPIKNNQNISYYSYKKLSSETSKSAPLINCAIAKKKHKINHSLRIYLDESKTQKNTASNAIKELNELLENEPHYSEIIILNWFIYKLEIDKNKVSSVNTYRSRICSKWLDVSYNIDLLNVESDELDHIYQKILSLSKTKKTQIDISLILNSFHTFAVQNYGFPPVTTFNSSQNQKYSFVRVGFIPESLYVDLCNSICKLSNFDKPSQEAIKCIIIIAYRTGFRISEILKLQLIDIENSIKQLTYIRENDYGNLKNYSSLRKAPLKTLLTSHELEIVNNYIKSKKVTVNFGLNNLAFSETNNPDIMLEKQNVSGGIKSILYELTGQNFVFHDLRHTALSRLQIILEDNKTLIKCLTSYSENEILRIQNFFIGHLTSVIKDKYWAISGLAGHISPETTLTHYLHFTDVILGDKLKSSKQNLSLNACINITGLSSRIISRGINNVNKNQKSISLNILNKILLNKITKFSKRIRSYKTRKPKLIHKEAPKKLSVFDYWNILNEIEKGTEAQYLINNFHLPKNEINNLITSARNIVGIVTKKNKSRLFNKRKVKTPILEYLAPRKPTTEVEIQETKEAMRLLQKIYLNHKNLIDSCVDYFIHNKVSSYNYLVFSCPEIFKNYIKLLSMVFSSNRILLNLEVTKLKNKYKQIKYWKHPKLARSAFWTYEVIITENSKIKKATYPLGKLKLRILHPQKSERGTNSIAFIFHMFAILNNAEIDFSIK